MDHDYFKEHSIKAIWFIKVYKYIKVCNYSNDSNNSNIDSISSPFIIIILFIFYVLWNKFKLKNVTINIDATLQNYIYGNKTSVSVVFVNRVISLSNQRNFSHEWMQLTDYFLRRISIVKVTNRNANINIRTCINSHQR